MIPQNAQRILRELITQSYEMGFDRYYPLAPIAARLSITEMLYDETLRDGLLWNLGQYGRTQLITFSTHGTHAAIREDRKSTVEKWAQFHPAMITDTHDSIAT